MITRYETIPVFHETKVLLDAFGKKNETYDDLINRLLKIAKGNKS